jgi:hypothetical protein
MTRTTASESTEWRSSLLLAGTKRRTTRAKWCVTLRGFGVGVGCAGLDEGQLRCGDRVFATSAPVVSAAAEARIAAEAREVASGAAATG